MITEKLKGTGVALVTPFDEKYKVDFESLAKLLTFINSKGIHYWVIHGTTGETATTTRAEKREILDFVVTYNDKTLPIVYGLGGNNTQETLHELNQITFQCVDAILSVTPYYNKPSQKGLYQHYQAIADNAPVPIILYNVPSRTGVNLAADTVIQLSEHPNIVGIKEASGNLEQCIEIAQNTQEDFLLISGDDILTVPMMSIGAVGVISTLANIFPNQLCRMTEAALNNDYQEARLVQRSLLAVHKLIVKEGNPVGTKEFLAAVNLCKHHVRLPLALCSKDSRQQISKIMKA